MRIVLTGSGSGGHVQPYGPVIEEIRSHLAREKNLLPNRLDPNSTEITFIGPTTRESRNYFLHYDVPVIHILSGKLRRYLSFSTVWDMFGRLPLGIVQALVHVWRVMPDTVISLGGFGSFPVVLAAVTYRIPVLLHSSDVIPGLANKILSPVASAITVGFHETAPNFSRYKRKVFVTGTPTRADLTSITYSEGRRQFGIVDNERLLLVMGGSQGAQQINEILLKVLPELLEHMSIIHITGQANYDAIKAVVDDMLKKIARKTSYQSYAHLTDTMPHALAAADGIITRAGASSLGEIVKLRKASLIIPLSDSAGDHQRQNALIFKSAGAAIVLDPSNLTREIFEKNVLRLMLDEEIRRRLIKDVGDLGFPNAARDIARLACRLASGYAPAKNNRDSSPSVVH